MGEIKIYAGWIVGSNIISNLEAEISVEVYVDLFPTDDTPEGVFRIIKILEPFEELKVRMIDWLRKNPLKYNYIFTYHQEILDEFENSLLSVTPTTWIESGYQFPDKSFGVSSLVGNKHNNPFVNSLDGYHIRWETHNSSRKILVPKRFFVSSHAPVDDVDYSKELVLGESKIPLFDTQFHIAIENTRLIRNAFSEKIIDCFRTKTVPIYYGPENIGDFFNKEGIITVNSTLDIIDACNRLTSETYESMKEAIEDNYNRSFEYSSFTDSIINQVKNILRITK